MDINTSNIGKDKNHKYIGHCCGNNFIILDCCDAELSKQFKSDFALNNIDKFGVDSALFYRKSKEKDIFMEIFEKDGSESEACGNGAILIAYLLGIDDGTIEMKNNIVLVSGDSETLAISISIKLPHSEKYCNKNGLFIKIGEPHIIYIVDDIEKFDIIKVGEELQVGYPEGVNVNAIQKNNDSCYLIKTYERGVFAVTDSCGTGSLSAYIAISHFNDTQIEEPIEFKSNGGSHWVSRDKNMLKLITLKKFCKIKSV